MLSGGQGYERLGAVAVAATEYFLDFLSGRSGTIFLVLDGSRFCVSRTKNGEEKCECESKWRGRRKEVGVRKWQWMEVSD